MSDSRAPILVTGCAGFIGMHCALRLLARGDAVVGIDNLNAYYDPALKQARLALVVATGQAIRNGLALLGIAAPLEM